MDGGRDVPVTFRYSGRMLAQELPLIELRALGELDLRGGDGARLESVLAQPKRLALLIYLALARPHGFHRRDSLLALFWPEGDAEHARAALRQALHFLRHSLREPVICTQGDEAIGLAEDIACDVSAFEAALAAGDLERALGLYAGDLLPGFFAEGAPGFERWLEEERARLRARALQACLALADAREAADPLAAGTWLRRALAMAPDDDALLLRVMRLLARSGDRSGALSAFETHARQLWTDLELEPSPAARALAAELRREAAGPSASPSAPAQPIQPPASDAAAHELGHPTVHSAVKPARRAGVVALILIASLAALLYAVSRRRSPAAGERLDPNLILVLPFRVAGADADRAYLREGMVDLLSVALGADTAGPRVLDPRSLMGALQRWGVTRAGDLAPDSALQIARRLKAGRLALGEVVSVPGGLVLSASLRRVDTGERLPPISVRGPPDSLPSLVDRLAAGLLSIEANAGHDRTAYLTTGSLPALRSYLEGQALFRQGHPHEAAARFRSAVELDSTFALAAFALYGAASWGTDPTELEPTLALAWRWRAHLRADDRALLQATAGRRYPAPTPVLERIADWQEAAQRFPYRPEFRVELGEILLHWGSFVNLPGVLPQARSAFEQAVALDSTLMLALFHLMEIAALQGDTAGFRRYERMLLGGRTEPYFRIASVVAGAHLGLPRAVAALHAFADTAPAEAAPNLMAWVTFGYMDPALADAVARRRAHSPVDYELITYLLAYALNRGRPSAALMWGDSLAAKSGLPHHRERIRIENALFWDGSAPAAAAAAARLQAEPAERLSPHELYDLELWRLRQHDTRGAEAAIRRIALARDSARSALGTAALRARILKSVLAAETRNADLPALLTGLDSALLAGVATPVPPVTVATLMQGNVVLAQLQLASGDAAAALRAANRCPLLYGRLLYASTFRRLQALAALAAGDDATANRAATAYLRLRSDPEPELRGELAAFQRQFQLRYEGARSR